MGKMKFYLLLPMIAVLAFGSISFAQSIDKEALKAEIRAELKAELKRELMAELKSETKADIQEATIGMRSVLKADFRDEIRSEIMQEDIKATVAECLAGDGCGDILGGLFKGVTVGGFLDVNYMYNMRNHGEGYGTARSPGFGGAAQARENANGIVNFIGENEDNQFTLENFAMFFDKAITDEDPIGWQMHTYWGEKAKRITFLGEGTGTAGGSDDTARNDIFTIAAANISWNAPVFGKHVKLTMGKMYTWIGYELVENIGNPNYTHGMVYNNAIPFTHMGISADVSEFLPGDKVGLTLYYVNGWDSFIDNNEAKSFGAYLTYAPNDDFFISLGVIYGNEGWNNREGSLDPGGPLGAAAVALNTTGFASNNNGGATMMYDIVMTYALPQVEKLSLGFNWDHGYVEDFVIHNDGSGVLGSTITGTSGAHWWAAVTYAMYDFTDNQQGAFRWEYFDDSDGAKAFGNTMYSLTYTHNITVRNHLLLRPEIRYNKYSIDTDAVGRVPGADFLTPGDKGNTADDEVILAFGAEYVF